MYVNKYVCMFLLIECLSMDTVESVAEVPLHQGHSGAVEKLLYQPPRSCLSQIASCESQPYRSLNMVDHENWSSLFNNVLIASRSTYVYETASDLLASMSGKSNDTKLVTSQTKLTNEHLM